MSELMRFFVWLAWKDSGTIGHYCAVAASPRDALAIVVNGRDNAITAGEAYEWPAALGGPNVKLDKPKGFRLGDARTIETALQALRVTTESVPRVTVQRSGGPRPPAGIPPWRVPPAPTGRRGARKEAS